MSGFWARPRLVAALALALALLGAAGLGPGWGQGTDATAVLVDISPSCAGVFPLPAGARKFAHSDLHRALREAREGGAARVVLYSDGCDTTGAPPTNTGIPVDFVVVPRSDNIALESLELPPRVGAGVPFAVRVRVGRSACVADGASDVRVRLFRDGEAVGAPRRVRLLPGARRAINFVDQVDLAGVVHYAVREEGGAGGAGTGGTGGTGDDSLEARLRVGDEPQVVVIGPPPPWLAQAAFVSTPFRAGLALDGFDAALMTAPLPAGPAAQRVAQAVRAGMGLLVVGDPGAEGTQLAELLPLTATPPDGRAVVLMLDLSGSMERHLDALRQAYFDLCARLAPGDQTALVRFRGHVVDASEWAPARDAERLWKPAVARGNTALLPAAERALSMLREVPARFRRLYVVSDGEWEDAEDDDLVALFDASPGVYRAVLFVGDGTRADPPADARKLFPVHAATGASIASALLKLEAAAPDRWVRQEVTATAFDPPAWLRGGVPATRVFRDFPRLYPRGVDERVVLGARDVPLLAARVEGGRIAQAASAAATNEALLRACATDTGGVRLSACRDGRGVHLVAFGSGGAEWRIGDERIAAIASGPDRWEATLARAPAGAFDVACGGVVVRVGALASYELAGLHPDEAYGAALARLSGGRFLRDPQVAQAVRRELPVRATASITLLAAALVVLAAAYLRRGS